MDASKWATQYMKKQGWSEGGGIGKTLQGRSDIVKVKYKFDIHGVGHDQAETHKFKWWERAFETAAAAIEVGDDQKLKRTGKSGPVVSTALPVSKALNKAMLYGRFVKKGTLQGGKLTEEPQDSDSSDDSSDDENDKIGQVVQVTDAELFKRCGGLTGHKGARHGHTMTAKLDRLKKTEEEGMKRLLAVRQQQAVRKAKEDETDNTWEKPLFEGEVVKPVRQFEEPEVDEENNEIVKKKKKKKNKQVEKKVEEVPEEVVEETPKKKKKRKIENEEKCEETQEVTEEVVEEVVEEETPKKKKKKKRKSEPVEQEEVVEETAEEVVEEPVKKKKKKKHKVQEVEEEAEPVKKKKKKSKKSKTE